MNAEPETAQVARVDRGVVTLWTADGAEVRATTSTAAKDVVVGDLVEVDRAAERVDRALPRRTELVRRAARGAQRAQVIAANVDVVALVHGLDRPFNPRRLERELVAAHASGARPVVVLTKADLVDDPAPTVDAAARAAPGTPVLAVSNRSGVGLVELRRELGAPATVVLLGASGVGKSTLVNSLHGSPLRREGEVRRGDAKGRHTTTAAELIRLDGELYLVDTPGVRAFGLWHDEVAVDRAFPEIVERTGACRFDDCRHLHEPGCAVLDAVARGDADVERLEHWRQLTAEAASRRARP